MKQGRESLGIPVQNLILSSFKSVTMEICSFGDCHVDMWTTGFK